MPIDFDRLLDGTIFAAEAGQSEAAFAAGNQFERACAGTDGSWTPLLDALDAAGLLVGPGGIEDIAAIKGTASQAARTVDRIERMLDGDRSIVLINQPVLRFTYGGRLLTIRPDAICLVPIGGQIHIVELKGFTVRDGVYPAGKIGAALDQTSVYAHVLRGLVGEITDAHGQPRFNPSQVVSDYVYVACASKMGMTPVVTGPHDVRRRREALAHRLAVAEPAVATGPTPAISALTVADSPADRLDAFEQLAAFHGTAYRPSCLEHCGAAKYCRHAEADAPRRIGPDPRLNAIGSIAAASTYLEDPSVAPAELEPAVDDLHRLRVITDVARADAGIAVPSPRRPRRRPARKVS
jgi:hypothetical protein